MTWYCAKVTSCNATGLCSVTAVPLSVAPSPILSLCNGNPWLITDSPLTDAKSVNDQFQAMTTNSQVQAGQLQILQNLNSAFSIDNASALQISLAIALVWGLAFGIKQVIKTIASTSNESE